MTRELSNSYTLHRELRFHDPWEAKDTPPSLSLYYPQFLSLKESENRVMLVSTADQTPQMPGIFTPSFNKSLLRTFHGLSLESETDTIPVLMNWSRWLA